MQKNQRKNNWVTSNKIMSYMKEQGITKTRAGLISAGLSNGFIRRSSDGFHWEYHFESVKEWIQNLLNIPKEFSNFSQIIKRYNLSYTKVYRLYSLNKSNIEHIKRHGSVYVKDQDFKKIIDQRN